MCRVIECYLNAHNSLGNHIVFFHGYNELRHRGCLAYCSDINQRIKTPFLKWIKMVTVPPECSWSHSAVFYNGLQIIPFLPRYPLSEGVGWFSR